MLFIVSAVLSGDLFKCWIATTWLNRRVNSCLCIRRNLKNVVKENLEKENVDFLRMFFNWELKQSLNVILLGNLKIIFEAQLYLNGIIIISKVKYGVCIIFLNSK